MAVVQTDKLIFDSNAKKLNLSLLWLTNTKMGRITRKRTECLLMREKDLHRLQMKKFKDQQLLFFSPSWMRVG